MGSINATIAHGRTARGASLRWARIAKFSKLCLHGPAAWRVFSLVSLRSAGLRSAMCVLGFLARRFAVFPWLPATTNPGRQVLCFKESEPLAYFSRRPSRFTTLPAKKAMARQQRSQNHRSWQSAHFFGGRPLGHGKTCPYPCQGAANARGGLY